jgi:membrane protein DedA with SNARE-associated domain
VSAALDWLAGLPTWLIYVTLGAGAGLENLVPPVPADTFVVIGGLLASRGTVNAVWALAIIWFCNVASALLIYGLGFRYGRGFFEGRPGRLLLNEHQVTRIRRFYKRFGVWAIFLSRFLPGLRAVVPAFAGVSHLGVVSVAVPIAVASAIWYGALMWAGVFAGRNLARVEAWLQGTNRGLLAVTAVLVAAFAIWWLRTRRKA